jgi:small subunit ribosomal protein S1
VAGLKKKMESSMPVTDEGWWSSVLAEENRNGSPPTARPLNKPVEGDKISSGLVGEFEKTTTPEKPVADWQQVQDLFRKDEIIKLKVTAFNRGGLLVEGEGLYGFVPFSHLVDLAGHTDHASREHDLESYVGASLQLKVIECVPEDGRIVFSERAAQAEPGRRTALFNELVPGQTVSGTVTNVTEFGVFVDLGGVEGLIHISELSWGRVNHPNQIVQVGQTVAVQVLDLTPERCRVALSLKRLTPNPWERAESEFPPGSVLPATITTVVSFGAFARLDAGVEGLVHASEMDLSDGIPVRDVLSEGQVVKVRVLHIDAAHQRMGLSMKSITQD